MELKILDKNTFEDYLMDYKYKNFLQSSKMEQVYKLSGWEITYVGIVDKEEIKAATLLLSLKNKLNKKFFYAPRGLLVDYNDDKILKEFINKLKKYIKNQKGYMLRIDPVIPRVERDIDGNIIDGGYNNEWIVNKLINLGCKHLGYNVGTDVSKQVNWVFQLNLDGKTVDKVFSDFKPNVRNNINKVKKYGIQISELDYDDLPIFKKITQDTSERIGFLDKSIEYYQKMYRSFHDCNEIKFLLATIDLKQYLDTLNFDLKEHKQKLL